MPHPSRLIGREDDCARLEKIIADVGTITLVGPGGVGKSRLARELVAWREEFGEVVPFANLADLAPYSTEAAVAAALGYESAEAASMGLADQGGIVVLDNCEHVVRAVCRFVELLRSAPADVTIVATSRAPLGLKGERVFPVQPLALPSPGGHDADRAPAVELFLDRAHAAGATLVPTVRLLADVGELCRRLDGLPLAIELAAARTRAITPSELLDLFDQRLDVLRRASGSGERHDSMRTAIEVSTSLLSDSERTFFRQLGVFTGPFDLGLAHAVAGEPTGGRVGTLDTLTVLVDRSLVTAETDGGLTRYRLLEVLRDYAGGELRETGGLAAVEERFVEAMAVVADQFVAEAMDRWEPSLVMAATAQYANLVRAVELCLERDAAPDRAFRLLLPMFAAVHAGHPAGVWAIGSRVLERWRDSEAPLRAEALAVLATAAALDGRHVHVPALAEAVVASETASQVAVAVAERAWGLVAREEDPADAAGHFRRAAVAAQHGGFAALGREMRVLEASQIDLAGDRDGALELLFAAQRDGRAAGDLLFTALGHLVEACVLMRAGDLDAADAAVTAAEDDVALMRQPWWTAAALRTRAALASLQPGGWPDAAPRWREAVDYAASLGAIGELAILLRTAAGVAEHVAEHDIAATLLGAAPVSSAITVLPDLFPDDLATLRSRVRPSRTTHLVEALARARAALDAVHERPAAPAGTDIEADAGTVVAQAETAELIAEGDTWCIVFNGRPARVRNVKGINDLAVLLKRPRVEVHAIELMGAADVGDAGPALDDRARSEYRSRIVELQQEIDEARELNDTAHADRAEVELDALVEQLSEAFGLGGRARSTGSSSERARSAVTSRIRAAIRKLSQIHPELGRHLTYSVRTGTWCSYEPEIDVRWRVDAPR